MTKLSVVLFFGISLGTIGCDAASHDMTAPEGRGPDQESAALNRLTHSIVGADGRIISATALGSGLRMLGRAPSAAAATTTQCDGALILGTYDAVEVAPGGECLLLGVTVTNSVTALSGSQLFIQGASVIGGSVFGLDAAAVQVNEESTIHGDMDVQGGGGPALASCSVDNARIDGNLSCRNQDPGSPVIRAEQGATSIGGNVSLENNVIPLGNVLILLTTSVGGNADVNKNTGSGFKTVSDNTVALTLQCKKNDVPFVSAANVASKIKGQCL